MKKSIILIGTIIWFGIVWASFFENFDINAYIEFNLGYVIGSLAFSIIPLYIAIRYYKKEDKK